MRRSPAGFTLVEMLIALAIFGMITAAGVTLLSLVARTQTTSDRLLDEVGQIRRLAALMGADLAQATSRLWRDGPGAPQRAFAGFPGGSGGTEVPLLTVIRAGEGGESGSSVQRVVWRLRGNALERLAFARVDGDAGAVGVGLVRGVSMVSMRFRDREGEWGSAWDPTDRTQLPVAVELLLASEAHRQVRFAFLVAPGIRR